MPEQKRFIYVLRNLYNVQENQKVPKFLQRELFFDPYTLKIGDCIILIAIRLIVTVFIGFTADVIHVFFKIQDM